MDYTSFTWWTETWPLDCSVWTYTTTAKLAIFSGNNSCSFDCTHLYINGCHKYLPGFTDTGCI